MPDRTITRCVWLIALLLFVQGGVLFAAVDDALVEHLEEYLFVVKSVSGAIVASLVTVIGVLWAALRRSQSQFIATLKEFASQGKNHPT